jgi:hypothetical protein
VVFPKSRIVHKKITVQAWGSYGYWLAA